MIIYQATKEDFSGDVLLDRIETKILDFFKKHLNHSTSKNEISSWKNSLQYMDRVLNDNSIPDDCGVAIEYQLPQSSKRMDFILTGLGESNIEYAILVELKQWSNMCLPWLCDNNRINGTTATERDEENSSSVLWQ